MNLQEELRKIDEFFDSMKIEEFDNMLIRNGAEDLSYKLDSDTEFFYKLNDEYKSIISKVKKQQEEYKKILDGNRESISLYDNINLEAA